jgi:hypothetical protein
VKRILAFGIEVDHAGLAKNGWQRARDGQAINVQKRCCVNLRGCRELFVAITRFRNSI